MAHRSSAALVGLLAVLAAPPATADESPPSPAPVSPAEAPLAPADVETAASGFSWKSAAIFAGGAATAFVAHEGCHLLANLALGNTPHLESVSFLGFIPFFSIAPGITCVGDRCTKQDGQPFGAGRRGMFTILSAGLQCQHLADEIILSDEPMLRHVDAPFRKGMLAFNTFTSIGYVLANWLTIEPPAGDLHGLYNVAGAPRQLTNVLFLAVAVMDLTRYFFPEIPVVPWVSRAAKVTTIGLVFTL